MDLKGYIKGRLQLLRRWDYILLYSYYSHRYQQEDKRVLMLSDSRQELSGNLLFIDRELRKRGIVPITFLKKNLAARKSFQEKRILCREMAKASHILVDDFYPLIYPIRLRKTCKLIQVWHAMGAFKTVGFSRVGKQGGPSLYSYTHKNYTDAIVSAEAIRKDYAEAFRMDRNQVHAVGIPRTDIFFDEDYRTTVREKLWEQYPFMKGKKIMLFAPTFRGKGQPTAHYPYEWVDFDRLRENFGDEYICLIKMHPFTRNEIPKGIVDDSFYFDLTGEREINDLLFVTDLLITDYSSVIFEASLLDIPTVFYVPDLEEYASSRDFYYPFEEYMYGSRADDMDELIGAIEKAGNDREKLQSFRDKFCSACDGHSTERFVDTLIFD